MNQKSTNRNHLTHEKSPYLLQHAKNPVNWYPWSEEAFAEAKERDLPIFLSIGYSTCHWCHVMAHESFEDPEIAEILNKNYIAVKVDREERPDIDSVYMKVCQALTGSGGWPLTVIMTPDQKPFWAGTYLPKKAFPGSPIPGLTELLLEISNQWNTNRSTLLHAGNKITDHIRQTAQKNESAAFSKALLRQAADELLQIFDHKWGGFGTAPKFPSPHNLLFLLKQSQFEQNPQAEEAVRFTLNQMYRGGIFDHIGGGFSRYSTDKKWLVPHFEKMLYDNAMLTLAYVEYFRISKDPFYQIVARRVMDYVLSELTSPNGGFYCGQDADSDGIEGKYYVFTPEEIAEVLGDEDGAFFCHWYEVTAPGNFEGKSIPNLLENPDYSTFPPQINPLQEKLYQYRLQRTSLHKDDKVLTSWNGLMIAAFARAARILGDPVYLDAAENASGFLFSHLTNSAGDLMIRWRDGQAAHLGQLDDYAFFTLGLLYLYDATLKTDYLTKAISLAEKMVSDFSDEKAGGLFLYSEKGEQLIHRPKESYDGAIPSGNSAAAHVFIRLFHLTGEIKWKTLAEKQCSWIANEADSYLPGFTFGLLAIAELLYPSTQLVCVNAENRIPGELKQYLRDHSGTELSVLFKSPENEKTLTEAAPFTKDYPIPESGSFYYFCENGTCKAPVRTLK